MSDPHELIRVGKVTLTREEPERGIVVSALIRISAKKNNAPLDAEDVRTFVAIAMADQTIADREWAELWVVYITYIDRMTKKGLDALYSVLRARVEERAPEFGYTADGAGDLLFVYHTHYNNMTEDAKKELLGVLSKFIC